MSKKTKYFDSIVCIDIEGTCDYPKPEWDYEIIEIGVCLLDNKTLEIKNSRGILVKPESSPITPYCTQLTTITQDLLDREGVTLKEAIDILHTEYRIDRRTWISWGFYDRRMLMNDCAAKDIDFTWVDHINIKNALAVEYGWNKEIGLDKALEMFSLKHEGTPHRGISDAKSVARIFRRHLSRVRNIKEPTEVFNLSPSPEILVARSKRLSPEEIQIRKQHFNEVIERIGPLPINLVAARKLPKG